MGNFHHSLNRQFPCPFFRFTLTLCVFFRFCLSFADFFSAGEFFYWKIFFAGNSFWRKLFVPGFFYVGKLFLPEVFCAGKYLYLNLQNKCPLFSTFFVRFKKNGQLFWRQKKMKFVRFKKKTDIYSGGQLFWRLRYVRISHFCEGNSRCPSKKIKEPKKWDHRTFN